MRRVRWTDGLERGFIQREHISMGSVMSVSLHTERVGESADSIRGDMGPDSFRFAGSTRTWAGQERETTPGSGHDPVPEISVSMLMCSNA